MQTNENNFISLWNHIYNLRETNPNQLEKTHFLRQRSHTGYIYNNHVPFPEKVQSLWEQRYFKDPDFLTYNNQNTPRIDKHSDYEQILYLTLRSYDHTRGPWESFVWGHKTEIIRYRNINRNDESIEDKIDYYGTTQQLDHKIYSNLNIQ